MNKGLLISLLFILTRTALAQVDPSLNLVPNGDFEDKRAGRDKPSHRPWRFVNTVDYYVTSGPGRSIYLDALDWEIPPPKSGVAYAGVRIYPEYREFLQIKLKEPLKENTRYYFEMWVSSSHDHNYYLREMGANLSHRKPYYTNKATVYTNPPQIELFQKKGIVSNDSNMWVPISGVYRAKGGEEYLTVGNFSKHKFSDRMKKRQWYVPDYYRFQAYYWIDAISLVEIIDVPKKEQEIATLFDTTVVLPDTVAYNMEEENYIYRIERDSSVILEKIRFEFGSDELISYAYSDMELVLEYLNDNPTARVAIEGHTDDIGSEEDNQKLSERRAKTIYHYLLKNRIDKDRLEYYGKGETEPIADNQTNDGRRDNRRVELILLSK